MRSAKLIYRAAFRPNRLFDHRELLAAYFESLGLKRVARPVDSLDDYLRAKDAAA